VSLPNPRVRVDWPKDGRRNSPEVCAYRDAVQALSRDVRVQLDRLGVPRYVDGRPLTLLGRVDALLAMYEFERAADGR
jgi:hypothetical protein